jgi:hypothetical protein
MGRRGDRGEDEERRVVVHLPLPQHTPVNIQNTRDRDCERDREDVKRQETAPASGHVSTQIRGC